jgi:hypothetical protein
MPADAKGSFKQAFGANLSIRVYLKPVFGYLETLNNLADVPELQ